MDVPDSPARTQAVPLYGKSAKMPNAKHSFMHWPQKPPTSQPGELNNQIGKPNMYCAMKLGQQATRIEVA